MFVDLEKAYNRVPTELIWYALRRKGVSDAYKPNPGLCLLFVVITDVITEEIEEGTPWVMLFADDLWLLL